MCGVNGIVRLVGPPVTAAELGRMAAATAHRGPDEAGYAIVDAGRVGLGSVRLSVIDLHNGQQPMCTDDGSVWVCFNGEIYDHYEHRQRLQARGHRFRTRCDTEVLLHLYRQYGTDFLRLLNGEYAFLLWDDEHNRLIAARDRFGVKPLFYHRRPGEVILSSETKGIFALDRVARELSTEYLTGPAFGAKSRADSLFAGVHNLKPGHYIEIADGRISQERPYWTPTFCTDPVTDWGTAKEAVRQLLDAAIARRMVADVPVGVYLSGGLDSTLICGAMAQQHSRIKAFNIGFTGTEYDESAAARDTAKHYGVQLESMSCTIDDLVAGMEDAVYHVEAPLYNPHSVARFYLSRLVRGCGYKVCLSGEGSDEIFGGYPYFKLERIWRLLRGSRPQRRLGNRLWQTFKETEQRSESLLWNRSRAWKKHRQPFGYPCYFQVDVESRLHRMVDFLDKDALGLTAWSCPEDIFTRNYDVRLMRTLHPFNATRLISYNILSNTLIPSLGDRVEMAHSVECRTPFLDPTLVGLAETLSADHMLQLDGPRAELREKSVLRAAYASLLPPALRTGRKHPFLAPDWWCFHETPRGRSLFDAYLSVDALKAAGIWEPSKIQQVRSLWPLFPRRSRLKKSASLLMGLVLGTQIVHRVLVKDRIRLAPGFDRAAMVDRTAEPAGRRAAG